MKFWAEDRDSIVAGAECFEPFVVLLAIVESSAEAMNGNARILFE